MDIEMDNFMEEIVQKFTSQDIIRANAAAEAAEIESLEKQLSLFKEQMEKYDECLQEMRTVNLKNIESAQDVQQLADKAGEKLGQTAEEVEAASVSRMKETSDLFISGINKTLDESLAKIAEIKETANNTEEINEIVYGLQTKMEEVIKNLEDFLHTDNVKVYRNVQAAMVEEMDKRMEESRAESRKIAKKCNVTFAFVLVTMIFSIAGLAVTLMRIFGLF